MRLKELLEQSPKRKLTGKNKTIVTFVAVAMSVYQLAQSTFLTVQPMLHYCIHLTFILVLACLIYTPLSKGDKSKITRLDYVKVLLIAGIGVYFCFQMARYVVRWPMVDPLTTTDVIFGVLYVVAIIGLTKRSMGYILPLIGVIFLLYALLGHLLPGSLTHRPLASIDVLDQLIFTVNGVYSSPIAAASTYVFLFVLFGSFFASSGAGDFFYKFSMAVAGKYTGGAGKVAIVTSGLFGMINGSPTANVVTTGSFTIPMMKRSGYDSIFTGAITAVAATGGGIMPPIMGTAAFLMVEMAGIPYRDIAIAAAVPGLLYYAALLLVVHFRAKKLGLSGVREENMPTVLETISDGGIFIIPIIILVVLLMRGFTATMSAVYGIVAVIVVSFFRKTTRLSVKGIIKALEDGAVSSVAISLSCAVAGCVISGLMTTGLSGKLASMILSVGGNYVLSSMLLTAAICTLLGMGMPVAAAYSLTAALCVPSLYELGLKPMEAHMFVVYFSTLSAITPPVAVASYAAAGIADTNASSVGWQACRIGLVSFVVPFIFTLEPRLMLTPANFTLYSIWIVISAGIGVYILCVGLEGFMRKTVSGSLRFFLIIAGLLLVYPEFYSDFVGLLAFVLLMIQQYMPPKTIVR
ncbi:MAG: TRAP transporter fused permease subunit [Synergistaceae bacterium]|nr:TRAP transporter fused permease subunit [Synergistaceae bacterium]